MGNKVRGRAAKRRDTKNRALFRGTKQDGTPLSLMNNSQGAHWRKACRAQRAKWQEENPTSLPSEMPLWLQPGKANVPGSAPTPESFGSVDGLGASRPGKRIRLAIESATVASMIAEVDAVAGVDPSASSSSGHGGETSQATPEEIASMHSLLVDMLDEIGVDA